jgi:hypothetical protein
VAVAAGNWQWQLAVSVAGWQWEKAEHLRERMKKRKYIVYDVFY